MAILLSEFTCKLCQNKIAFNIHDNQTYITKQPHQKFFGMQLTSFRVSHEIGGDRHINTVLIDHKGYFRGHIDAYKEAIGQDSFVVDAVLHRLGTDDRTPLHEHPFIDIFLFLDLKELWVVDLICPSNIKPLDLATVVINRIEKARVIYTELPSYLTLQVADKNLNIWINENKVLIVSIDIENLNIDFELLMQMILNFYTNEEEISPNRRAILLVLTTLTRTELIKEDHPKVRTILKDPRIFTTVTIKYPWQIPRIAARLSKTFAIPEEILLAFLRGKITVINLLESQYFKEVLDMIDFIERRNLLET
jgi:hypothetical protein